MKRVAGECWVEEDLTLCPAHKGLVGVEQPVVVVLLAAQVSGDGREANNGRNNGEKEKIMHGVYELLYQTGQYNLFLQSHRVESMILQCDIKYFYKPVLNLIDYKTNNFRWCRWGSQVCAR